MNKFVLLPLFLLLFFTAKAQDKIISIKLDTIHCEIVSISNDRIFYELKKDDGSVAGKSISLSQVSEYLTSDQSGKKSKMSKQESSMPDNPLCLGLNAGWSTMPWYLDNYEAFSALPDYYNKLETGIHINASAHYLFNSFLGLGVEYSFFETSSSGSIPSEYYPSAFLISSEEYHLYANYLGASILFQQHPDAQQKIVISESLSAGVMFLRMEYQYVYPSPGVIQSTSYTDITNNMLLNGNSFSGKVGLTAEYRLSEAVSVGLGGSFIWSLLKKASLESKETDSSNYSVNDQELSDAMKLSRIDYSIVLRYYF